MAINKLVAQPGPKANPWVECNISPDNHFFHMPDGVWYTWREDGKREGPYRTEAFRQWLYSKQLSAEEVHRFLASVPVIHDELAVYASDERTVQVGDKLYLNTFKRPTLKPIDGDCADILRIIRNICGGDERGVKWVLDWLCVQVKALYRGEPPAKTGVAVVFFGLAKGAGKGVFGEVLSALLGRSNAVTIGQEEMEDRFNGYLDGKLLVIANEVFVNDKRSQGTINRMKRWITDNSVMIENKRVNKGERANLSNFVIFSNDLRPVVVEHDDRRFTIFETGDRIPVELGKLVAEDARREGPLVRAFLHFLLERELSGEFKFFTPYQNSLRGELGDTSGNSVEKFALDVRAYGIEAVSSLPPPFLYVKIDEKFLAREKLFEIYRDWCKSNGYMPLGSRLFWSYLRRLVPGIDVDRQMRLEGRVIRVVAGLPNKEMEDVRAEAAVG